MAAFNVAAFWSYVHQDDELDEGHIRRLANRFRAEYELTIGDIDLFVDRTSLQWGDEWRARTHRALTEATFLIPVLSLRYFDRDECRRELATFINQARDLGRRELVLPILYVRIPDFNADNPDRLIAQTSQIQYENWTERRLEDASTQQYRKAVNGLAKRLGVAVRTLGPVVDPVVHDPEILTAALARGDHLFTELLEAVVTDRVLIRQLNSTGDEFGRNRRRPTRDSEAALRRQLHEANEYVRLTDRRLATADMQLNCAQALNSPIAKAIRAAEDDPKYESVLAPLGERVREIASHITQPVQATWQGQASTSSRLRRVLPDPIERDGRAELSVQEAHEIVLKWHDRLERLHRARRSG